MRLALVIVVFGFALTHCELANAAFGCRLFSFFSGKSKSRQAQASESLPVGEFLKGNSDLEKAQQWLEIDYQQRLKEVDVGREFTDVYRSPPDQAQIIISIPNWQKMTSPELNDAIAKKIMEPYENESSDERRP